MSPKLGKRNQKARLIRLRKFAQSGTKEKEEETGAFIPNGPRLGSRVIELIIYSKSYGDKTIIRVILILAFRLREFVALSDLYGAGRQTLFSLIWDTYQDSGEIISWRYRAG